MMYQRMEAVRFQSKAVPVSFKNVSWKLNSRVCKLVHTSDTQLAEEPVLHSIQMLLTNSSGSEHLYKATQLHWYADRIDVVRELVETDFAEPHSLGSLARAAGMSRLHFAHVSANSWVFRPTPICSVGVWRPRASD